MPPALIYDKAIPLHRTMFAACIYSSGTVAGATSECWDRWGGGDAWEAESASIHTCYLLPY